MIPVFLVSLFVYLCILICMFAWRCMVEHVDPRLPAGLLPLVARTASEVSDEGIARFRAAHRGQVLGELMDIADAARLGNPDDPRWLKIRLDVMDRVSKLLRLDEVEKVPPTVGDVDRGMLVASALAALGVLEARGR